MTVSFSKSISVLHASIRENARQARLAGDEEAAAWWDGRERVFQEVLQAANAAALEHAQRWAGVTRTGYHGAKVNGAETGRWDEAGIVVSSWLQGTSRDGDPQDHVHNQFARMARTTATGDGGRWTRWRCGRSCRRSPQSRPRMSRLACRVSSAWRGFRDRRQGKRDTRRDAGADGRVLDPDRSDQGRDAAVCGGVDRAVRPGAERARAAAHPAARHPGHAAGQGRRRHRLGRLRAPVGRDARRRACPRRA